MQEVKTLKALSKLLSRGIDVVKKIGCINYIKLFIFDFFFTPLHVNLKSTSVKKTT